MFLLLYRLLFLPLILLSSPHYLARMCKRGGYSSGFSARFGKVPPLPPKTKTTRRIWLHAVSVGETLAIAPLIESLASDPDTQIYFTTTTSTAYKLAREKLAPHLIAIAYFPIDWLPFSARAWKQIQPDLAILAEGERWPEHLRQASLRNIPVLLINARISDRSFRRMSRFPRLAKFLNTGITTTLAASQQDASRLQQLGISPDRLQVTGNIKLDLNIPLLSQNEIANLRRDLGFSPDAPILLGSSTWPGEEETLIAAYRALKNQPNQHRHLHLLIVPRHAERRAELTRLLDSANIPWHLRSRGPATHQVEITVADTTGELRQLTQLARLVFVGKTLPPHHEGQSPVDAATLGKPILFGPQLTNFREISQTLTAQNAALHVPNSEALISQILTLWDNSALLSQMSANAQTWHRANQGAIAQTLSVIRQYLSPKTTSPGTSTPAQNNS